MLAGRRNVMSEGTEGSSLSLLSAVQIFLLCLFMPHFFSSWKMQGENQQTWERLRNVIHWVRVKIKYSANKHSCWVCTQWK